MTGPPRGEGWLNALLNSIALKARKGQLKQDPQMSDMEASAICIHAFGRFFRTRTFTLLHRLSGRHTIAVWVGPSAVITVQHVKQ
jgi:hypothetical protein